MPDPLYLSTWFPSFEVEDMLPQFLGVARYFPFSAAQPGITYLALHPVSWEEPTILEQRFRPGIPPEEAALIASDLLHEDYAYRFEAYWDLWALPEAARQDASWELRPSLVTFIVRGVEFEEGAYQQEGHIEVDFGLDTPFLQEMVQLDSQTEERIRANVQKLVEFTTQVEKNSGVSGRLLWSESENTLAQKLIARLQRVQ